MRAAEQLPFKKGPVKDRLLADLSKAGLPDMPFGYRWNSSDRLTGDEIGALVFGHEFRGRHVQTGDPYTRSTTAVGAANVTIGPTSTVGTSRIEGDFLCSIWDSDVGTYCNAFFRNPNGTHEAQNEYVLVTPRESFEFSVIK